MDLTERALSERIEMSWRADMTRALDRYAALVGGTRSSVVRGLVAELLDARMPGWRDSDDQSALAEQAVSRRDAVASRDCGCRSERHRLSCPDRP